MEQLTETENNRLKFLEDAGHLSIATTTKPLIQRVTHILLRDNKDFERYFQPISVAFGPLHHDNSPDSKLRRGEKNKLQMAAKFIQYTGTQKEVFYSNIKAEINSLKECYDSRQIEKWSDEYLAWMFLVDGCAVLFFIHQDATDNLDELRAKDDLLAYVKLDLFLLENQLPYRLLQILMSSCSTVHRNLQHGEEERESLAEVLKASITIFINKNAISPVEQEQQRHQQLEEQQPEQLNNQTYQQQQQQQQQQQEQQQQQQSEITIDQTQEERDPAHLLELLWRRMTKSEKEEESDGTTSMGQSSNSNPGGRNRHYRYTFQNVKELKEKGILLKVSATSSIRDISLLKYFFMPILSQPPITVDDFTGAKLMNLIAYEMCPDFKNEFEITSYMSFLDSLIDQREDVQELRDAGVLHNGLGSDEAVALLFNEIGKNLVPNPKLHLDLKLGIEAQCNTIFTPLMAKVYHTYIRNPWRILALLFTIGFFLISFQ